MIKLPFAGSGSLFVLLLLMVFQTTDTAQDCPDGYSSSCGGINISYPFVLPTDPTSCGDSAYYLDCENNVTILYPFGALTTNPLKYYVKAINYDNFTIRLVDTGVDKDNCSSLPSFHLTSSDKQVMSYSFYKYKQYSENMSEWETLPTEKISLIKCKNPVNSSVYLDTSPCINSSSSLSHSETFYTYAYVGQLKGYDLRDGCSLEMESLMLPITDPKNRNLSFIEVHRQMAFGFELSWHQINCRNCDICMCYLDTKDHLQCYPPTTVYEDPSYFYLKKENTSHSTFYSAFHAFKGIFLAIGSAIRVWGLYIYYLCVGIGDLNEDVVQNTEGDPFKVAIYTLTLPGMILTLRNLCGFPLVVAFLIYKWRMRHLSGYDTIEEFLQTQNNLMPIRYAYSDIKKMTGSFKEMLGKGGFGSVYKGKLRSGQFAAIKMLEKSKANGQDFINEVATIGRIHHANVVRLIGFCSERSKNALVYEFMSNGSLDSHIFNPERSISLSWEKLYEISLGIARGIEYLHRGCDIQILHFDIKPHNILLDENFSPKISDFGLAKFCPKMDNIASLTAARGTIGYMAPELFYKNIGRVSYKADVYSFGMLLLEMAGKRKNLKAPAADAPEENLSQIYYPLLVHDKLSDGKLEIEDATDEENEIVRKMIITGLWCIQMQPSTRPPMNKVVEMLEGGLELLQMPPKPLLYSVKSMQQEQDGEQSSVDFSEYSSSQFEIPT